MSDTFKILVVDDDDIELKFLERNIKKLGANCILTRNSYEVKDLLLKERPDLILTDLMMPKKDGIAILREAKKIDPNILVIILTAYGTIDSAVSAVKAGAFDYIQKPYTVEQFETSVQKAINYRRLRIENVMLRGEIKESYHFNNIIGKSEAMQKIFEKVVKLSKSDANVIVYGESGTGKELIARSIHANSLRSTNAFIPVDCVALPENLLESELFGYEKGAFTGAESMRRGLLELADNGTLFLDEICELAPNLQAKLLRVIQEREFRRVGGKELIKVNVRIISATNRQPLEAISEGQFREDLYYRLNVIPVELPPLRERKEDIPLLLNHFLESFCHAQRLPIKTIEPTAMNALVNFYWPGNVRELKNLAERLVSLVDSNEIRLSDIPEYIACSDKSNFNCPFVSDLDLPLIEARKRILEDFDKEYLINLLQQSNGNISQAAKSAQISRRTIYRMIRTYNLEKFV